PRHRAEFICAPDGRRRAVAVASPVCFSPAQPGSFPRRCFVGRRCRRRTALAGGRRLLPAARARRNGPGRRQDDVYGRGVSGGKESISDESSWVASVLCERIGGERARREGTGL